MRYSHRGEQPVLHRRHVLQRRQQRRCRGRRYTRAGTRPHPGRPDRQPGDLLDRSSRATWATSRPRSMATTQATRRTRPLRQVLPPVVHALHRQHPDGRHLLPADRDEHEDRRHARRPFGGGANRFAHAGRARRQLRSGVTRIYGQGRIGIYANSPAANTTFYLARLLPGAKGRTLVLNFFDIGDAAPPGHDHRAAAGGLERRRQLPGLHVHGSARQHRPDRRGARSRPPPPAARSRT